MGIELARRGACVGLLARRRDLLEEIVDEITAAGGRALALPGGCQSRRFSARGRLRAAPQIWLYRFAGSERWRGRHNLRC